MADLKIQPKRQATQPKSVTNSNSTSTQGVTAPGKTSRVRPAASGDGGYTPSREVTERRAVDHGAGGGTVTRDTGSFGNFMRNLKAGVGLDVDGDGITVDHSNPQTGSNVNNSSYAKVKGTDYDDRLTVNVNGDGAADTAGGGRPITPLRATTDAKLGDGDDTVQLNSHPNVTGIPSHVDNNVDLGSGNNRAYINNAHDNRSHRISINGQDISGQQNGFGGTANNGINRSNFRSDGPLTIQYAKGQPALDIPQDSPLYGKVSTADGVISYRP